MPDDEGELGVIEVCLVSVMGSDLVSHTVSDRVVDFIMLGPDLEKILKHEAKPDFMECVSDYCLTFQLRERVLDFLGQAKMNAKLKLYIHRFQTVVKRDFSPADLEKSLEGMYGLEHYSAYLGTLEARGSRVFLGGVEFGRGALERWFETCLAEIWRDPKISSEWAMGLGRAIAAHTREVERRSLETFRRTLGDEVVNQFSEEGEITLTSINGRKYTITEDGEVFAHTRDGPIERICVRVEGEGRLPKYDVVLAKYLVIRDHPEQIETPHRRRGRIGGGLRTLEEERVMLGFEIERLYARLAELEGELERRRRAERG